MPAEKYTLKTAAVPRGRKAERAATRLILGEDPGVWHGTRSELLPEILSSGKLLPGGGNAYSPYVGLQGGGSVELPEVYSGYGAPVPRYMSEAHPGVVVPSKPVLEAPGRVLSRKERNIPPHRKRLGHVPFYETGLVPPRVIPSPYQDPGRAKEWLLTPNDIPIPPRATVIATRQQRAPVEYLIQKNRLRHIPSDIFYRKYEELKDFPRRVAPIQVPPPAIVANPLLQSLKNRAASTLSSLSQNVAAPVGNFFSRLKSRYTP